jgi:microcystin-dependent protein
VKPTIKIIYYQFDKEEIKKMKRGLIVLFVLAFLTGFFWVQGLYAGVPQMINYQGTLTDKNGAPVANGNYNLEFKIYDVASGGAVLWSEKWDTTTSQIPVVGGTFNTMLGFLSPIPTSFFADHPVAYLGIKVGTDSEMLPRQQITSVGYAFTAGNGVPKGGIIMWSGAVDQIPVGWALCDGVERPLSDGTKVTPPDLRDRFVVGAGAMYTVGSKGGEAAHTLTINEIPSHSHQLTNLAIRGLQYGSGSKLTAYDWGMGNFVSDNTGGGAPHNNLPPYYALAYIMKL